MWFVSSMRYLLELKKSHALSEARDPGSFLWSNDLRTTAEILRGVYPERTTEILRFAQNYKRRAQDDTFRISSHLPSRGITAHSEHAEPRGGDRRSAIIKTALSPLPGLFGRIGTDFSPRLSPWATLLRPPQRAPKPDRAYSSAYGLRGRGHCQGLDSKLLNSARAQRMEKTKDIPGVGTA